MSEDVDASTASSVSQKDTMARQWERTLWDKERQPGQVIGGLIAGGAKVRNFLGARGEHYWHPTVLDKGGRRLVYPTGLIIPAYGAEGLRAGFSFQVIIDSMGPDDSDSIVMVPYPRFTQTGGIDPKRSEILLLRIGQAQDLDRLIRTPATP